MEDINYDFKDLDDDESFKLLGKSFGGFLQDRTLYFDNHIAKGILVKSTLSEGLWIRKWKFTTFQKIILHKLPAPETEKKFIIIYFLNPAIFSLNRGPKKIKIHGSYNNIFLTSETVMDFSVMPKQPFYVLDISLTRSWLLEQFNNTDPVFKDVLNQHINKNPEEVSPKPCSIDEYKTLHELDLTDSEDVLRTRSRVYNLIFNFFTKIINVNRATMIQRNFYYEQIMQVELMITENLQQLPSLVAIAEKVNMSVSSLLRHFKLIHGKSIYEYYISRKMEIAKKMILKSNMTIKEIAKKLGYKQVSAFIESFTKHLGYSPGCLKHTGNELSFVE